MDDTNSAITISHDNAIKLVHNLDKLQSMKDFKYDWNGNGGLPFTSDAISLFISIINGVYVQPELSPTGRNSLVIQYEVNDIYLAFEIFVDKISRVYIPHHDYNNAAVEDVVVNSGSIDYINQSIEFLYQH
jgi:hypothetical protein